MAVALTLPEGVEYRKSGVHPRIRGGRGGAAHQRNGVVYWPGIPANNKNKAGKTTYTTYTASLVVGCVVCCLRAMASHP
jgi:hypothetical protein